MITIPYFVPDEPLQSAICSVALRGIKTTIIFPANKELLDVGVNIFEYEGGLLHSKTFTLDGKPSLIGSANMDRRSFDLNYENNILLYDPNMTNQLRDLQFEYLEKANLITLQDVNNWPLKRRHWNNTIAMLGTLL
ncbi:MAG: hypothetical protein H6625_07490 [Bdellovibrionaceae bacterium]|nr:hypothetical protein [Pseudobdellovibrionaceae bacterium]